MTTEIDAVELCCMTIPAAAKVLGVSRRRLQDYIDQGRLEAAMCLGHHVVSRASVASFTRRPQGRKKSQ